MRVEVEVDERWVTTWYNLVLGDVDNLHNMQIFSFLDTHPYPFNIRQDIIDPWPPPRPLFALWSLLTFPQINFDQDISFYLLTCVPISLDHDHPRRPLCVVKFTNVPVMVNIDVNSVFRQVSTKGKASCQHKLYFSQPLESTNGEPASS